MKVESRTQGAAIKMLRSIRGVIKRDRMKDVKFREDLCV